MRRVHGRAIAGRGLISVTAAILLLLGGTLNSAYAAEPPPAPDTGGWNVDDNSPQNRLPVTEAMRVKVRDALQSYLATPGVTPSDRASAQTQLRAAGGMLAASNLSSGTTSVAAAAPTSRTLTYTYTYAYQVKSYYCGPATAVMLISQNGIYNSRDGYNVPLTQAGLARFDYLQTDANGATTWSSTAMQFGIARWMNNQGWGYVQVQSPTAAVMKGAFTRVVGTNGKMIAADTYENKNGPHYNGHPVTKSIGHWIAGYGYSGSGATSYWADPSIYYFTHAARTFKATTSTFTTTFLQVHGALY